MATFFRSREIENVNLGWVRFPGFPAVCLLNEVQNRIIHDFSRVELRIFIKKYGIRVRQSVPMEKRLFRRHDCGGSGLVLDAASVTKLIFHVKSSPRFKAQRQCKKIQGNDQTTFQPQNTSAQTEVVQGGITYGQMLASRAARKFANNSPKMTSKFNGDQDSGFETDVQDQQFGNSINVGRESWLSKVGCISVQPIDHDHGNISNLTEPWRSEGNIQPYPLRIFSKHWRKKRSQHYFCKQHIPLLLKHLTESKPDIGTQTSILEKKSSFWDASHHAIQGMRGGGQELNKAGSD